MPGPTDDQIRSLGAALDELRRHLVSNGDGPPSPRQVTELAVAFVPSAEQAGITLVQERRRPRTIGATGELAELVDAIQYASGEGPCLEAIERNDVTLVADLAVSARWPGFTPRCIEETGVRSMFSIRLVLGPGARGALNFYAHRPDAFDDDDLATGALMAPFAGLALQSALNEERALHLEDALHSSRQIGTAVGILMARELVTQDQAFALLSAASQRLNRKLRDVAKEVTETGQLPDVVPHRRTTSPG